MLGGGGGGGTLEGRHWRGDGVGSDAERFNKHMSHIIIQKKKPIMKKLAL